MKTVFLTLILCVASPLLRAQSYVPFYNDLADSCSLDSITTYLQDFESFGVKEYNTSGIIDTKNWILDKYNQWGYTDIVEDDFGIFGGNTLTNLVITKQGTLYPDTYVIIDGHYDTKNGAGSNDNGSGTAIILELARILKDVPTEYSIKFIHFSGEEIGLTGSQHYVNNLVIPSNMDIKVVFNIDEVGGENGLNNNTIVCERDESQPYTNDAQSAVMTDQLATCIGLYSTLQTEISFAYASDYVPFMNNDYIVTGLYEKNESPYAHTTQDIIANMDIPYVYQISRGSMGALAHFAVAYKEVGIEENELTKLRIYPNPATKKLTIKSLESSSSMNVRIYSVNGVLVLERTSSESESTINTSNLDSGTYIVLVETESGVITEQLIISGN